MRWITLEFPEFAFDGIEIPGAIDPTSVHRMILRVDTDRPATTVVPIVEDP